MNKIGPLPEGWEGAEEVRPYSRQDKEIPQYQYSWWNPVDKRWEYDYTTELQPGNIYIRRKRVNYESRTN